MKIESFVLMLAAAVFGCAERTTTPPPAEPRPATGIDIEAPGVDVRVGGGRGVEVETPNTEVEVPPRE